MKLLAKLFLILGIDIKPLFCGIKGHVYPKEWCDMWGYKNCKRCWYIPNKNKLRNNLWKSHSS